MQPTFAAGFGFRVSGFEFRRLKPTFAVGFGFRVSRFCFWVSPLEINFRCRFRVSDFGFRRLQPTSTGFRFSLVDVIHFIVGFGFPRSNFTSAVGFAFRVSGFRRLTPPFDAFFGFPFSAFVDRNYLSLSVSDLRTRVSYLDITFRSSLPVLGLGFR